MAAEIVELEQPRRRIEVLGEPLGVVELVALVVRMRAVVLRRGLVNGGDDGRSASGSGAIRPGPSTMRAMAKRALQSAPTIVRKHTIGSDDPGISIMQGSYKDCREKLAEIVRQYPDYPAVWGEDGESVVISHPDDFGGDIFDTTVKSRMTTKQVRIYLEPAPVIGSMEIVPPPIGMVKRPTRAASRHDSQSLLDQFQKKVSIGGFGILDSLWKAILAAVAFAMMIIHPNISADTIRLLGIVGYAGLIAQMVRR